MKRLIEKIIVAVNSSEHSHHAAMYAIMMAKDLKCQAKAVYVVDKATLKSLTLSKFFIQEENALYEAALKNDGRKYLDYVSNLAKAKGVKIETELLSGSVWGEIVKAADDFDADLILLGGKSNAGRNFSRQGTKYDTISQTYKDILLAAGCNVMIVNEGDLEKKFKIK